MRGLEMKYFVLKPASKKKDDPYARASAEAMLTYAESIEDDNPDLARDLRRWSTRCVIDNQRLPTEPTQ